MSDGGKGDRPRPISVSQAEYDSRWDAIFARDLKKEEPKSDEQVTDSGSTAANNNSDQQ